MKRIYVVDGNIASGKGDVLSTLKTIFNDVKCAVRKEPCFKWKSTTQSKDCTNNLLDLFYMDTARWAYTFETRCLISRIMDYKRITKPITFCERCWLSDKNVFTETLYNLGCLSNLEKELYNEFYEWEIKNAPQISGYIYVKRRPEECMKRLTQEEALGIQLSYLEQLHLQYEKLYVNTIFNVPVLIIDMDEIDLNDNTLLQKIQEVFPNLCSDLRVT